MTGLGGPREKITKTIRRKTVVPEFFAFEFVSEGKRVARVWRPAKTCVRRVDLAIKDGCPVALKSNAEWAIDVGPVRFESGIIRLDIEFRIERVIKDDLAVEEIAVLNFVRIVCICDEINALLGVDDRRVCRRKNSNRVRVRV